MDLDKASLLGKKVSEEPDFTGRTWIPISGSGSTTNSGLDANMQNSKLKMKMVIGTPLLMRLKNTSSLLRELKIHIAHKNS